LLFTFVCQAKMESLWYHVVLLVSFWSCFGLTFVYEGVKFSWLAYVWAFAWPFWMWILPLIYKLKKKKQDKLNHVDIKENIVAQEGLPRLVHMIVVGSCYALVNLKGNFAVWSPVAFILLVVGTLLIFWARFCLAEQWSGRPETRKGHKLVMTGPYAIIRHPIYTGLIVLSFGCALYAGAVVAYIAALGVAVMFYIKLQVEEELLEKQFGEEYRQYRQKTTKVFPLLF